MLKKLILFGSGCGLIVFITLLTTQVRSADENKSAQAQRAKEPSDPVDPKRTEDEAAIRKSTSAFIAAIESGDAKAVASAWTEQGEYISDDGTTIRGRSAIEAAYGRAFAKSKKIKIEFTVDSIRFLSKDTAIEEGYAKSFKGASEQSTHSRYSVLHVREGDRWLMALLREWPDEGMNLRDLEWLIGTWETNNDEATVRTTYTWGVNKNSIHCQVSIKSKLLNVSAHQSIMRDPRTGQLRSWIFDDDGGFGDGLWSRDGKRWLISATGVQADGSELTATNIMTQLDKDSFTWQSTERTLNGEDVPNIPPVKVTRAK
jgi:uncharacterized protein (TIGR02246 family)